MAIAKVWLSWDLSGQCEPCRTKLNSWLEDKTDYEEDPDIASFCVFYYRYEQNVIRSLQDDIFEILKECEECIPNMYAICRIINRRDGRRYICRHLCIILDQSSNLLIL